MSDILNEASRAFTDVHLTDEFFAKALSHGLGQAVGVCSMNLTAGSAIGDNFCSDIYRAVVDYRPITADETNEPTRVSLIVKALPFTELRGPLLQEMAVFDKEVKMYRNALPRLSALLGGERLSARCYYAESEPVQIIVFEDLKEDGFRMTDRLIGLDEVHCGLVVQKLARFHAASMRLQEQDEDSMKEFNYGVFKPDAHHNVVLQAIFQKGLGQVIEVMETWKGYDGTRAKLAKLLVSTS